MPSTKRVVIDGTPVYGVDVRPDTRCAHYDSDRDVIAIRFACCGDYYPCLDCHDQLTDHDREPWPPETFDTPAVLCGACVAELTIAAYLDCGSVCPACDAVFNPGCRTHWPEYFSIEPGAEPVDRDGPAR